MSEAQNHKSQFSADDIQQYVEGKLSARQMHEMEKAALDDPFLADAMEGLESSINRQGTGPIHADLAALQKRLEDRISGKRKKGILLLNPSWWQVAAALAILLGGGIVSYRVLNSKENKQGIARTVISERKIARKDQEIPFASPSADSARANARAVADTEKKQRTIAKSEIKKQPPAGPADHARTALKKNIAAAAQRKSGDQDREKGKAEAESESLVRTERIARSKSPTALASEGQDDSEQNASRVSKSPAAGSFSGKVMDMENRPVEGATISIKNGSQAVISDHEGFFKLKDKKPDSVIQVMVHSPGFETLQATLLSDNDIAGNTINLKSNRAALNEVVVTGYLARKNLLTDFASDNTIKHAVPLIGWTRYRDYIQKNKKTRTDSSGLQILEVVTFTVKANGKLSNFSIEQSYSDEYDREAIRLIKEGPGWKLVNGRKCKAKLSIEF